MRLTRTKSHPTRKTLVKCFVFVVFLAFAASVQGQCPGKANVSARDPLHMLVLGDSIMWGQGLRQERKIWWRIKCWLQEKTGREVRERIEAHSGAAIETTQSLDAVVQSRDAEVPSFTPTINEQVTHARAYYQDPGRVSLVLVNGCINDVDVRNLLNAATPLQPLETSIKEACGSRMQKLLRRILVEFPLAHVMVTGYYNIFSSETADNRFTRMLIKKLSSLEREKLDVTDSEIRERLVTISDLWYQISTHSLSEAVKAVNGEAAPGLEPRVRFVEITFSPEHAFAAPDTLLWNFKFASTSLSGLRKAIVILSLGTAAYKPNDDVRELRSRRCKETFKKTRKDESKKEKEIRESNELACRYASLGHPNHVGALIYAEAIKGQLHGIVDKAGWKHDLANVSTQ